MATLLWAGGSHAWSEHEHIRLVDNALSALQASDKDGTSKRTSDVLRQMWSTVRQDERLAKQLCTEMATTYGTCVGMPALPMLAGDHSCSTTELERSLTESWSHDVVDESNEAATATARLKTRTFSEEEIRAMRLEIRRNLDLRLTSADPGYLERADGNIAHFVLPRKADEDLSAYLRRAVAPEQKPSAIATYALFHTAALKQAFAARLADETNRSAMLRQAFFDEMFALHFLEDAFSAGHVASWIHTDPERLGTHDYYCMHGIHGRTWAGKEYVLLGDAFLDDPDVQQATLAATESLRQLVWAIQPDAAPSGIMNRDDEAALEYASVNDHFDVCKNKNIGRMMLLPYHTGYLERVIRNAPVPDVEKPGLPQFRNEYGLFVPVSVSAGGGMNWYTGLRGTNGEFVVFFNGDVRVGAGFGFASDGILSERQDALMFVQAVAELGTNDYLQANIGFGFQFRLPFTYLPGDGLLFFPMKYFGSRLGASAFESGLKGDHTLFGIRNVLYQGTQTRIQFDLGREAAFVWRYQLGFRSANGQVADSPELVIDRWEATMPIISMRVAHTFAGRLGNDLHFRLLGRIGTTIATRPMQSENFYVGFLVTMTNSARFYL